MDIDTVTIHQVIDGIPREEEVPASTVDSWAAHGWLPGPFPRDADDDDRPPKAGRGSSFAEWVDYAAKRDIVLEVGATRDDIIAAVEALDALDAQDAVADEPIDSPPAGDSETSAVAENTTDPEEG